MGNGLAISLLGQLNLASVAGIGGLGTMTVGLAAAAADRGDRARLEVAKAGKPVAATRPCGAAGSIGCWTCATLVMIEERILKGIILTDTGTKNLPYLVVPSSTQRYPCYWCYW